jgi:Raf kinase inhibitor-like YbhB/YbcL family protein
MRKYIVFMVTGIMVFAGCKGSKQSNSDSKGGQAMEIKVTSTAFDDGGRIPSRYTCEGEDVSVPLAWKTDAKGVVSFALICDDPDAPMGTFVHWVLYNIPAGTTELPEGMPADKDLPNGAKQGVGSSGKTGYMGPCPPSGEHRYFFKVYALDTAVNPSGKVDKAKLLQAMEGHILANGQIMGKYKKASK